MSTKKLKGAQLRKFRSDVARLKEKGLVSKRVDARSQAPTSYMLSQVKKYADVIEGKAAVLHAPKVSEAKKFEGAFRTKRKAIVVPKEKGEMVRLSKQGEIFSTRKIDGATVRKTIYRRKIESASDLPRGKNIFYTIPFGGKGRFTTDDPDELILFMAGYSDRYKDWQNYIEIERITPDEAEDIGTGLVYD